MRTVKWNAFLSGLCGVAALLGVVAASAHADVTTEKGASILVFPKVRVTADFDTIIQITNTSNSMVHAHCYYVNGTLLAFWQEIDFDIWLTKQQPTHWLASQGRLVNPFDNFTPVAPAGQRNGAGFDPGHVPPVPLPFEGELKCVEVTESGEPITGNHLKGEATLKVLTQTVNATVNPTLTSGFLSVGDVSKYNAIGIMGNPDAVPSNPLVLGGGVYAACPEKLILNHFATGASHPAAGQLAQFAGINVNSAIFTELTLVPCREDFENQIPTTVTVQFLVFNEFEERFSASTTLTCWLNTELTRIDGSTIGRSVFSAPVLGSTVAHTEITPVVQPDGFSGGLVGVVERITAGNLTGTPVIASSRAAYNLHSEGSFVPPAGPDQIRLIERIQ